MKPIRILQVLTIMNRGGAETMVMNYYRNVDRSKVQFDFLLHRQERGAFDDEIEQLGGKIYRLNSISFKNISKYYRALDHFFKEHTEYKVIHSHLNALSVFVLKYAEKHKVPVRIAHSHTSLYNLNLNPFSKERHSLQFAFKFFAQNILKRNITKYANHYFSCGDKAGYWLYGKKNASRIKNINNAIDTEAFIYDPTIAQQMKSELQIQNKTVVGHVGNFVVEKNHSFLIEVFKEFSTKVDNAVLLLVGGGGGRKAIEEKVQEEQLTESVHFLGVRSDVPKVLQAMDVFLFPSTNEGLPVTLIEAQASGLQIIASNEVSSELNITGNLSFVSLKKSPKIWSEHVLKSSKYNRTNTFDKIVEGNYDIKSNAKALQEFYHNQIN